MAACMMIDRDLARLLPTADPSTPETESLDKATETMIVMIIAVELRARLLTEAGTRTKTATERVIEVRAAIEAELVALVEASPVWDRNAYHIDGLENIRVIRDRQTTYSREREDRARARGASDWNCRTCGIPRPDMDSTGPPGASAPKIANEGDNDVAPEGQPSQFLLIRGLAASVTEELLAKGVSKLYRPSGNNDSAPDNQKKGSKVASTTGDSNLGAREGSLRRVLLVRDRRTNESWGYGFAEFAGITDAQAAMARLNSFEKFTISSKPVLVSYIHGGVFVPVMNAPSGASYFTFSPSNNPSLKLMYWDDAAFVTELVVSTEEDDAAQEQRANKTTSNQGDAQAKGMKDSDKGKKRKVDGPASASTKKLAMPSQLQFWSDRHAELHGINRDAAGNPAESSSSVTPATESAPPAIEPAAPAIEPAAPAIEPAAPPAPSFADFDKNRCLLCMQDLVNAGHLRYHERESDIHRENLKDINLRIRGICWMIIYHVIPMPTPNYKDSKDEYREALEREYSVPPTARSFADLKRNCCLLCFTEFDTPEDVLVHDRVSKRHLEQLQDEEAVKEGLDRLKQAGIAQDIKPAAPTAPDAPTAPTAAAAPAAPTAPTVPAAPDAPAAPEYRDRAKERRAAFGRDDANARQRPAEPEEEDEAPVQTTSIGASLLSKMGWTEGTGLGAQGTGVTEPIPTEIYAQGVGLGAQGGRLGEATEEAGRNTRGRYDEFLEKTRDTARQRYEEMDRS
ncbi:hypothetical protein E8E15_002284 [Penicillium rubens]|nr:hypothetical protein E8E15_002284 [Penicillium rubens]